MLTPLRVLILEDREDDAELMLQELRRAGFDPQWLRVETESDYLAHLDPELGVILADYSLPHFNAHRALQLLQKRGLDIPFIIVSGCIGEESAVECMKNGAADYLLKDRLARLGQAVRQALDQKRLHEEKQHAEERLVHEAFHDALTGLPNRALLLDRLGRFVLHRSRGEPYTFAALFLDLDGFKVVNESLGHAAGDQLIMGVSQRLVRCLRQVDTVARLGGDEFVILLDDIKNISNASRVADRIQRELEMPFHLDRREVFTSASIGIAFSGTGYDRPEDVIRDADTAMFRAKELGKARFVVFDTAMHTQAIARLKLETELRRALERQEFRVYYQPVISLKAGRITGFEALLRWAHPQLGLISPADYLSVAEEIGLLIPIGQWVLSEACRQVRAWQAQFTAHMPLTMSVNLSSKQFLQSDLVKQIDQILKETGLDGKSLKLEITETVVMENTESATTTLLQLRRLNIETYLDDFGTGYSSLSFLQRFPIDFLKIDHSFISRMGESEESWEIVRTIVTLAHNLSRKVIAEGVETTEQLALLRSMKCEYGQGNFFSKPLDPEAARTLLAAGRRW